MVDDASSSGRWSMSGKYDRWRLEEVVCTEEVVCMCEDFYSFFCFFVFFYFYSFSVVFLCDDHVGCTCLFTRPLG
jgi:hypothetical protein